MNFFPSPVDDEESAQRSRASYALMHGRARDKAIRTVKGDYTPTDHDWAASLSLAPFAIFSMVNLFQAANQECAAGIKVNTLDIMDLNGLVAIFRTNVQHCGDPAIRQMDWLSVSAMPASERQRKKDDFEAECQRSVEQISKLAAQVSRDVEGLAEDRIRVFVKRLIEATEECG
ncbi:hypothetical protein B0T26DRAFT_758059 [Lasiosphaeria miniovina]|uniref:Uncharacterized protein n=1 Tax=Lasiosphaeria miniovina TaxID=1954250 RepID=A0AA40DI23_9PEZI|nr:uncharacterized protein B0T26DRAFT_758059 [Lasiosphaeria miniovina]KAK0702111.1 hypothetical protein B0T26DRAFT_758059 [Lasiosphaeria miniovina]